MRVLVIECLLSAMVGAIAFRLSWAFSKSRKGSWGVSILLAIIALLMFPGNLDIWLVREFGKSPPAGLLASPLAVKALHSLCLLGGAWIASLVVAHRIKLGLEEEPRFKDL